MIPANDQSTKQLALGLIVSEKLHYELAISLPVESRTQTIESSLKNITRHANIIIDELNDSNLDPHLYSAISALILIKSNNPNVLRDESLEHFARSVATYAKTIPTKTDEEWNGSLSAPNQPLKDLSYFKINHFLNDLFTHFSINHEHQYKASHLAFYGYNHSQEATQHIEIETCKNLAIATATLFELTTALKVELTDIRAAILTPQTKTQAEKVLASTRIITGEAVKAEVLAKGKQDLPKYSDKFHDKIFEILLKKLDENYNLACHLYQTIMHPKNWTKIGFYFRMKFMDFIYRFFYY